MNKRRLKTAIKAHTRKIKLMRQALRDLKAQRRLLRKKLEKM